MSRACRITALLVVAGAWIAPPASAATATQTVTGTVAHVYGTVESSPPCHVATFYRWQDVPGTVSAEATYVYTGSNGSAPITIGSKAAPFDDGFDNYGFDASAPAGQHQLYAGYASLQGTGPRDCSQDEELVASRRGYAPTAEVTLTIDKATTAACKDAKRRLAAQKKAVRKLKGKSGKKAKRKLAKARKKQKTLRKAVAADC